MNEELEVEELPTLTEFNAVIKADNVKAGVSCPKCGTELHYTPNVAFPDEVYCPNRPCLFSGTKLHRRK